MFNLILAGLIAVSPVSDPETLTNDTVITLTSAGLGDEAIIAKIRGSNVRFQLTTDDLISLRKRGVSGPVIAAMLDASNRAPAASVASLSSPDPALPHPAGVYMFVDSTGTDPARMTRMDATVSSQAKTGGILGYAMTGGLASMSIKATIQNNTARVSTVNNKPTFYFFFDESNGGGSVGGGTWLAGTAALVVSPNEFSLVRLTAKKGRREARVGSTNIAGSKFGVMDKDRIEFDYELVRPGVYRVVPRAALNPGEYGFIYSVAGNVGGAMTARIFDFSVK